MDKVLLNLLTGTASTGVSITKGDETLISISIETGIRQSETIFKMIKDAFSYVDLTIKDIDAVSTLKGPGSFTGLRVGLAAAKAIAFAVNVPIVLVNTMDAIFHEANYEKEVLTIMDARRDRVYLKKHYGDERADEISEVAAIEPRENTVVVGENALKYKDIFTEKGYTFIPKKDVYLTIKGLTEAALRVSEDDYVDSLESRLDYLKKDSDVVTVKKEKL